MNRELAVNFEPLPGYRLIERLGAGGYGEVWRAEAPGGLIKAIKFVFGQKHEKRASNELRALEHIRDVRHPFLLSLERIEIVNDQLLIVTELADKSLKDRFDQCRRDGLRGIPRDELLGYLRDAADALDFMSDTQALQHLDIKPENLLLLAGHVKVADFGLVKDVRQSQVSLVGGMTPLYAAPEVFRGNPSRHSDQYSLAIVYQEMLSGTLPFAGSNAAELTLQHLNDEPDLAALSGADRYAVSRALSKDPLHRYASSREFIDALSKVAAQTTQFASELPTADPKAPLQFAGEAPRNAAKTEFFDDGESLDWQSPPELLPNLSFSDFRITDLPPIDLSGRDVRPVPTLVIGIGGTAGRVLSQLRRNIHEQFAGNRLPAVQLLLLDTDSQALASAAQTDCAGLTPDEMLNLPLRRPQHYRDNSQQLLHWLSRRWLYNIPRTLRTEGLRPLGRLALVDHARQAGQRIRRAMLQAIDAEATSASSAVAGQDFRKAALRVVVVASISGGTGGGMALDVGYAVRALLQKIGIPDARVIGLMMHSTDRDARHSELARVNAFSWLSEFNHFEQHGNPYPGDTSCGLPAHSPGVKAFDQTYLVHLGENLELTEFEQATQTVADYLRLNALSAAGAFFDACRDTLHGEKNAPRQIASNLRSFGLSRRTPASREFCDGFATAITQQVLESWIGGDRGNRPAAANEPAAAVADPSTSSIASTCDPDYIDLLRRLQLDAAGIFANSCALVELQLAGDPASFLSAWLEKRGAPAQDRAAQLQAVDQMFSGRYEGAADGQVSMLGIPPATIVKPLADKLRSEVRRWVTRRLDDPGHRLPSARRAVQWINTQLVEYAAQFQERQPTLAAKAAQLSANALAPTNTNKITGSRSGDANCFSATEYFALCLDRAALSAAQNAISSLLSDVKALSDEVTALSREINQIASVASRATQAGTEVSSNSPAEAGLAASLKAKLSEIAAHVDARLQVEYLESIGGLAKTIMQGGRPRAQLMAKLNELSRQAIHHALAAVNVLDRGDGLNGSPDDELKSALAFATPALLEFGGRRRVLAVLPGGSTAVHSQTAVAQRLNTPATILASPDSSLTLCVEADGLSLPHIALEFVERRRDRVEFAGRVHSRTDIAWSPLVSPTTPTESSAHPSAAAPATQSRQEMCKTLVL